MAKSFDDLTIADDFMFCKVMQNEGICKEFLLIEMIESLKDTFNKKRRRNKTGMILHIDVV